MWACLGFTMLFLSGGLPAQAARAPASAASFSGTDPGYDWRPNPLWNLPRPVLAAPVGSRTPPNDRQRDWELALRVRGAWRRDHDLSNLNLEVQVHKGIVQIFGPVPSEYFRHRAAEVAGAVPGVMRLENHLRVSPAAPALPRPAAARGNEPAAGPEAMSHPGELRANESGPSAPLFLTDRRPGSSPFAVPRGGAAVPSLAARSPVPSDPWRPANSRGTFTPRWGDPEARLLPPDPHWNLRGGDSAAKRDRLDAATLLPARDEQAALAYSIEHLLRGNPRFDRVRFSIQDGEVNLRGSVGSAADLADLSRALAHVHGVGPVRLFHVLIEP